MAVSMSLLKLMPGSAKQIFCPGHFTVEMANLQKVVLERDLTSTITEVSRPAGMLRRLPWKVKVCVRRYKPTVDVLEFP